MKTIKSTVIIIFLFISTLFCLFTGNEKGLIIPFSFTEIGLIQYLISNNISFDEFIHLIIILVIQMQLFTLFKFTVKSWRIISPFIFVLGFLILNFHDFDFRDWHYAIISLLPFFCIWFLLLTFKNKKNENI